MLVLPSTLQAPTPVPVLRRVQGGGMSLGMGLCCPTELPLNGASLYLISTLHALALAFSLHCPLCFGF